MFNYLDGSLYTSKKGIRIPTLLADLKRNVKRLTEESYSFMYGSTIGALRYFNVVKNYVDMSMVNRAVVKYSAEHHYTMTLYTVEGYTIVFKGIGSGYHGQGSRGAHDILKAVGFSDKQAGKIYERESFEIRRTVKK